MKSSFTFPLISDTKWPLLEHHRLHLSSATISVRMGKKRKAIHDDFQEVEGMNVHLYNDCVITFWLFRRLH